MVILKGQGEMGGINGKGSSGLAIFRKTPPLFSIKHACHSQ